MTHTTLDQDSLAEKAFADYQFGTNIMVTDSSGWAYTTPGNERTRKVFVENLGIDGEHAQTSVLSFTVRFDPNTGGLSEAYAIDEKGQVWGSLPKTPLNAKFVVGEWSHIFGAGSAETRCRIVIDLKKSSLVAAQEWVGYKFLAIHGERLKDLAESVIEVNVAHVNIDDWATDPVLTDDLPDWAMDTDQANVNQTTHEPLQGIPCEVGLRLTLDVKYSLHGENATEMMSRLRKLCEQAIGDGMLTGESDAEVVTYSIDVVGSPYPITEKEVADLMLNSIENGSLSLESIPDKLAQYGLMERYAFIDEMRERIAHLND